MWQRWQQPLQQGFRQSSLGRWFHGRDVQEQRIVTALCCLLLGTVLWLGFWQPAMDWKERARNQHRVALANFEWLRANEAALRNKPAAGRDGEASLRTISQSARTLGLQLNRLQPSDDGVSVVLQNQLFNDVVKFIYQLEERNGVNVVRASLDASDNAGRVNANLVFR